MVLSVINLNKRFLAQIAKRSTKPIIQNPDKLRYEDIIWKKLETTKISTGEDWKLIRNEVLNCGASRGQLKLNNIDAILIGVCTSMKKYDLAKDYINFLKKENIEPNLATLGRYFKMFYNKKVENKTNDEDENEIITLYKNLRIKYPILDLFTLESVIQALSVTKEWRICLELLNELKKISVPTDYAYSVIVSAAFSNAEESLGWELMNEMIAYNRNPMEITYLSYLDKFSSSSYIEKLLNYLQTNHLLININVAKKIYDILGNQMIFTTIKQGLCMNCKRNLKKTNISDEDFVQLKKRIIDNVIIGKDIFYKTTPNELEYFKQFVEKIDKFDVVIDGLNVAYSAGKNKSLATRANILYHVVSHFVKQKKKVLVFGRNHMKKWPKNIIHLILENATMFLTEDLSADDPYLLYCALNSGKNTMIITKDLMRGHKFLLKNVKDKNIFDVWLSQRQYQLLHVNDKGQAFFKPPLPYTVIAQKIGDYWHVPYETVDTIKDLKDVSWLCFKLDGT